MNKMPKITEYPDANKNPKRISNIIGLIIEGDGFHPLRVTYTENYCGVCNRGYVYFDEIVWC